MLAAGTTSLSSADPEVPVRIPFGRLDILVQSDVDTTIALIEAGNAADSDPEQGIIRIRHDLPEPVFEETLLHELLHFVWAQTALPELLPEQEETVVRSLAPWLNLLVKRR
jgi:hypothetical protein